ncbi:hypothetical protein [Senimuribacter intestinalis]|uniref:hypothetical protein n=1 Tax=Senimuribacter intestinalis TaxID=2941507 RepID=UPI002042416B|nr:hypothetical protein [Senimuribacter intestinalis]
MVDEMRKMRTAEEMFAYYHENVEHKMTTGLFGIEVSGPDDSLLDYEYLVPLLDDDEYVMTFFGDIYIDKYICKSIRRLNGRTCSQIND